MGSIKRQWAVANMPTVTFEFIDNETGDIV